ncbi:MAG: preprotein translocase subunit YajC [bacterium]|nr:preprotein translocase subunit YajC [bacterium]
MNILDMITIPGELTAYADGENQQTTQTEGAQANGPQGEVSPVMQSIVTFLPMILIIVLLYFMMIRPQRKREKETKEMINALKVGDKIVTIGGICGKVIKIKDEFVVIETGNIGSTGEKSYIKMERDSIKTVDAKQTA